MTVAFANKLPRQMQCTCCGLVKPRKGCKTVPGQGLVCAECVPALPAAPVPVAKPRRKDLGRWSARAVDRAPTPPAEPAVAPSVVRTLPKYDPRYGVGPSSVTPVFSALGIGRYLPEGEAA